MDGGFDQGWGAAPFGELTVAEREDVAYHRRTGLGDVLVNWFD